jgi:hypothetical protein
MNEMLRAVAHDADPPEAQLDAAVQGLETLVRQPADRHKALDLLAVDGLVTAAFAETDDAAKLDALARQAAVRLMALGNPLA